MKRRLVISGFVFGLLVASISWAVYTEVRETRLQALLEAVERAERDTPYIGTRSVTVYEAGRRHITVLKLSVADENRRHVEFVETHSEPPTGKTESKGRPGNLGRAPFFGGMPSFFRPSKGSKRPKFIDLSLVTRNYDVTVNGSKTVAGRRGDVIEIRSRHAGRPSYRMVADAENRFPLAFAVLDAAGAPVLEMDFQAIDFAPVFAKDLFAAPKKAEPLFDWVSLEQEEIASENLSGQVKFRAFAPRHLPKGFKLLSADRVRVKVNAPWAKLESTVLHLTYTDGMALFSIIEFPADDELWKQLKSLIPGLKDAGLSVEEKTGAVIARKITHRLGVALQLEHQGTVIIAAGNISADEIELSVETLVQR